MHEKNIEILRDEAARLLEFEAATLEEMIGVEGLLQPDDSEVEKQTITLGSAQEAIHVLREEMAKLENLEMVLAVVGTMKAGKSTTINALVGMEILPNRNRPMTTLPTLIRHVPGQNNPIVRFENIEPVNDLLNNLRSALSSRGHDDALARLVIDEEIAAFLESVRQGFSFERQHEGQKRIFQFLRNLNDLVRAARAVGMEFPFSRYIRIQDFPVIEVEFAHLREMENVKGRLALLDTPGPNESEQAHLKQVLKHQLVRASGVLAVLDYTQLKSAADADLRKDVFEIADLAQDRLSIMVNKFDQRDHNSDSAEKTKNFVVRDLMEGRLTTENVFPVSSRLAYLANYARHTQATMGNLPSPESTGWVKDFCKEAFGSRWERQIGNADDVVRACEDLWQDSQYDKLLKDVIVRSHSRSALFAIEAALAKIKDNALKMQNMLGIREAGLERSVKELQDSIKKLEADIGSIADCHKQARKLADKTTEDFDAAIKSAEKNAKKTISEKLTKYFKEGKLKEKKAAEEAKTAKVKQREKERTQFGGMLGDMLDDMLPYFAERKNREDDDLDFDPNSPVIKFDSSDEAQELLKRIQDAVKVIFTIHTESLRDKFVKLRNEFGLSFKKDVVDRSTEIIKSIAKHFEDKGLDISLEGIQIKNMDLSMLEIVSFEDMASEKVEQERARRAASYIGSSLTRFFGDIFDKDWGYEYYNKDVTKHVVDIEKVRKKALKFLESVHVKLHELVDAEIRRPVEAEILTFFGMFEDTVERLRGDMQQGIRDKEMGQKAQQRLLDALREVKKKSDYISIDGQELTTDIREFAKTYDADARTNAPVLPAGTDSGQPARQA